MIQLPKKIGKYSVIKKIDEGERCYIAKVKDECGIELALKILKGEERQLFYRDWKIMRELSINDKLKEHSLVPNVLDIDSENEMIFYPLELLGENLIGKTLELLPTLRLMQSISALLMDAHHYKKEKPLSIGGITHGNLDLSHILRVPYSDRWKLVGFRYNPSLQYFDQEEKASYKPSVVPPEFVETKRIDFATDIFQLGVIGYELITGKKVIQHDLVFPSKIKNNVPFYIDEIFKQSFKEPEERGTMENLNDIITKAIKQLERGSTTNYLPPSPDYLFEEAKYNLDSGDMKKGIKCLNYLASLYPEHIDGMLLLIDYIAENSDEMAYSDLSWEIKTTLANANDEKKKAMASGLFKIGASMLAENVDSYFNAIKNAAVIWQSASGKAGEVALKIKTELSDLLLLSGHPEKSAKLYEKMLKYAQAADVDSNHIKNNLGISYFKLENIRKSRKFFEDGKSFFQLNNLGVVEMISGRFDSAEKCFSDSLVKCEEEAQKKGNNENNVWKIYSNLAIALYSQQRFGEAIKAALESVTLKETANNADGVLLLIQQTIGMHSEGVISKRLMEIKDNCQHDLAIKVSMKIKNKKFKDVLYLLISRQES